MSYSPHNSLSDKFDNFPFGHNCMVHIQSAILPLHRTVHVQSIAQPVVGRASRKDTPSDDICIYMVYTGMNYKYLHMI